MRMMILADDKRVAIEDEGYDGLIYLFLTQLFTQCNGTTHTAKWNIKTLLQAR
jgi:hypothetical protein